MVSHTSAAATPDAPLASDRSAQEVLDALRRIVRTLREASRASERSIGLSAAQAFVLHRLAGAPALSLNDLAARTLTHQSSVSVVVTKLALRGLVARSASAADGRRVEIALTARGRALLARSPGAAAAQDRIIAGLSLIGARRRRALAVLLRQLVGAMALSDEQPEMFFEGSPRPRRAKGDRRARAS
jgi:DNA-binding MarR family transcriptional regulator